MIHYGGVKNAHEAVAALDMRVEEGKGFSRLQGFDPEGGSAEFHGEGVPVNTIDTGSNDFTEGVLA
jgi:hypothetical protein